MKVTRYNWFQSETGKALRWDEISPKEEEKECDHSICNCSKVVKERPEGEPNSIQTYVEDFFLFGDIKVVVTLFPDLWLRIYWDGKESCNEHHTYLMLNRDGFRVEHYCPKWTSVDYFFGTMKFGNTCDLSTLMNGHAPSKVVDRYTFRPQDIWIHGCEWGKEDYRILPTTETNAWWSFFSTATNIQGIAASHLNDKKPVDTIQHNMSCHYRFNSDIYNFAYDVLRYFQGFEGTDFYKLQTEIRDSIKE